MKILIEGELTVIHTYPQGKLIKNIQVFLLACLNSSSPLVSAKAQYFSLKSRQVSHKPPLLPAPSSDMLHHLWCLPSQLYFAQIATVSAATRKPRCIPPPLPAQLKLAAIYCQTIHSSVLSHRFTYGSTARCQPLLMTSITSTRFTTLPQVLRFLQKYLSSDPTSLLDQFTPSNCHKQLLLALIHK